MSNSHLLPSSTFSTLSQLFTRQRNPLTWVEFSLQAVHTGDFPTCVEEWIPFYDIEILLLELKEIKGQGTELVGFQSSGKKENILKVCRMQAYTVDSWGKKKRNPDLIWPKKAASGYLVKDWWKTASPQPLCWLLKICSSGFECKRGQGSEKERGCEKQPHFVVQVYHAVIRNILKSLMGMPTSTIFQSLPILWLFFFPAWRRPWSYKPSHCTVIHHSKSVIWLLFLFQLLHTQLHWQLLPSIDLLHLKSCTSQ